MSIRARLALWYGGLFVLGMAAICLLIYAVHVRTHYDDLDRSLVGAADHVSGESQAGAPGRSLAAPGAPEVVLRLYDQERGLEARSPDADLAPEVEPRSVLEAPAETAYGGLAGLAPQLVDVEAGRGGFGLAAGPEGGRWRVYALPVASPEDGYLVAAAPLTERDEASSRLLGLIAVLGAGVGATTVVAIVLLAGRALRPVAALTETADAISRSGDFGERVPVGERRDELSRLARTFNGMLDELERARRAERRFVADASHELRAPLTAIQGNLELLERYPDRPLADQREAVSEASRETGRLSRLVADLLALARADAGLSLRQDRVELDRVVLEALSTARRLANGQEVEIAALETAGIIGDTDRLQELFLILLDNALKYTPEDGRVVVNLCRHGYSAEVTVCDTGVGIAPEDLPHVFERFYRADKARTRDPGGTGLGLPIARWIVEQHEGEIRVQSQPGEGSTVTVCLPLAG